MSEIKISQLPEAAYSTPLDYFMVVQNGVNKKLRCTTFLKTLDSSDNIQFNPAQNPVNTRFSSSNSLNLLYLSGQSNFIGIDTDAPEAKFHIQGNLKIGSSSTDGITIYSNEDITFTLAVDDPQGPGYFKTLNASRESSNLIVENGVGVGRYELGNGVPGQKKIITLVSVPSGSKATIKVTNGVGFNMIDLKSAGQTIQLKCVTINSVQKWICIGNYLTILYTV